MFKQKNNYITSLLNEKSNTYCSTSYNYVYTIKLVMCGKLTTSCTRHVWLCSGGHPLSASKYIRYFLCSIFSIGLHYFSILSICCFNLCAHVYMCERECVYEKWLIICKTELINRSEYKHFTMINTKKQLFLNGYF